MAHQPTQAFNSRQGLAIFIMAIGLASSWISLNNGLPGDFVLDDYARVKYAEVETFDFKEMYRAVLDADSGVFGRSIPLMVLYITKVMSGNDPAVYKSHGIGLHLITGLIVFWLGGRLLSEGRLRETAASKAPWLVAAAAATLWLLHPIQVSTALYIVQQMTQLAVIFTLLTLISYIAMRKGLESRPRNAILPLCGFVVSSICALLSKEIAVLIPLYVLFIEWIVFGFRPPDPFTRRIYYGSITAICVFPLVLGFTYTIVNADNLLHDYVMRPFSPTERVGTQAVVIWRYLSMLLIPRLGAFSLYHDGITIYGITALPAMIALAAWAVTLITIIRVRHCAPVVSLASGLFVISHLMESTLLPLELMFEHRNYIGSAWIMLGLAGICAHFFLFSRFARFATVGFFSMILLSFGTMQAMRASAWADPYTFSVLMANENPASSRALSTFANYQARRGQLENAQNLIRTAIEKRKHDGSLSGLYLHLMMFHCYKDSIPEELFSSTLDSLKNAPVTSYTVTGLKGLRRRILDGDCPALTRDELIPLAVTAAQNSRTRLDYTYFLYGLAAVTSTEVGNLDDARKYALEAMKYSDSAPLPSLLDNYVILTQICILDQDQACAAASIKHAKGIDRRLVPIIGHDPRIPQLEQMLRENFPDKPGTANSS